MGKERNYGASKDSPDACFGGPREHAAPFIRMLAHPALLCRLQWMLGPGFSCHQNTVICSERGTGGQQMHAGAGPGAEQNLTPAGENNPQHLYAVRGHQTFCNKVNVAWQLTDTGPADGGFVSPLPNTTWLVFSKVNQGLEGAGDGRRWLCLAVSERRARCRTASSWASPWWASSACR